MGLPQLQRSLRPDELLLEYALDKPYSSLLAIDRRSITTFRLPPQREVETLIANYLASIDTADKNRLAAKQLCEVLLGPVWHRPQKRLIVVGHGALQSLPFDGLVTSDGHYVAETYFVTQPHRRPSTNCVPRGPRAKGPPGRRAVMQPGGRVAGRDGRSDSRVQRGPGPACSNRGTPVWDVTRLVELMDAATAVQQHATTGPVSDRATIEAEPCRPIRFALRCSRSGGQ